MGDSRGRLARWSCGRGGRASLILIATHLGVAAVAMLFWLIGSLEIFDRVRWVPVTLVVIVAVVGSLGLIVFFGVWGTVRTAGRDGGEDYENTFTPGVGYALGWLRWLMQIVAIAGLLCAVVLAWGDAKPWQIFGTEGAGELRERVEAMPVPDGWELTSHERDIPADERQSERRWLRFDVPDGYGADDLRAWITGPEWVEGENGEAFGAIRLEHCDPEDMSCRAQAVPDEGEPRIFVYARVDETFSGTRVEVQVRYREPEDLTEQLGEDLIARFGEMPVPDEWVGFNASAGGGDRLEMGMQYGVPEGFTVEDLEAWLDDADAWADFGGLTREPCEVDEEGMWFCGDIKVDAYDYLLDTTTADEFLSVDFDPATEVVRVVLRARG